MTTVDACPPSIYAPSAPAAAPLAAAAEFTCTTCGETFETAAELRQHCKSERHVYNTKRRLAGLKPISAELWERKLRESRAVTESKGTAHLKAKKEVKKEGGSQSGTSVKPDEPWTPVRCLFDSKKFRTVEENLTYMWRHYNFSIPDREYCTDVPGLLTYLYRKMSEPPYLCIFCNRPFEDHASVLRHMLDKRHTRVGTDARSRSGLVNTLSTMEMRAELEEFYDFHSSTREITERITNPKKKVAALLRFFDDDRDGRLTQPELAQLWEATTGQQLGAARYEAACGRAGVETKDGLGQAELERLYGEGLADLDAHFSVLQDLLAQKLQKRKEQKEKQKEQQQEPQQEQASKERLEELPQQQQQQEEQQREEQELDRQEEGLKEQQEEEEDEEEDEEDEEEEDDEDEEEGSSGTELLECEDEDEFEEVLRVLGLQRATLSEHGDLQLPNGAVAVHRDVAHIWRQRGNHLGALAQPTGATRARPALCAAATVAKRQQARENRRYVAVLRQQQRSELKLGIKASDLHKQKGLKVRSVYGDASGGR